MWAPFVNVGSSCKWCSTNKGLFSCILREKTWHTCGDWCIIDCQLMRCWWLDCPFACKLWNWFASILNFPLQFIELSDIWKVCDRRWTPQCKLAITACLINILNTIWYSRNQARFQDKVIHWKSAVNIGLNIIIVTHIYREGNVCADALANIGLNIIGFLWWQDAPNIIRSDVIKNMLGMPNYRFSTFWKGLGYIPLFFILYAFFLFEWNWVVCFALLLF